MSKVTSRKYSGVFYNKLANGDKAYYVRIKVDGKRKDIKIGLHSAGVRENICSVKRAELINEAKHGVVQTKDTGFDDLAQMYHRTKTNLKTHGDMVKRYEYIIEPFFKNIAIGKITEDMLYSFQRKLITTVVNKEKKKMSPATVNYYMTQVSSLLKYAVRQQMLVFNPASTIKQLKEDNDRQRYLSKDEMAELIEAVEHDEDLLLFVCLSLSTGGRMGAIINIHKRDINTSGGTISLADEKGSETYSVFITPRVMNLLVKRLPNIGVNDSLFNTNYRRIQRQMKKVLDLLFNVGLDVSDAKNRAVVHTLRHTFASHLAISGTPIFEIKELMNHKDINQTLRYAKLSPESGRLSVEGIIG